MRGAAVLESYVAGKLTRYVRFASLFVSHCDVNSLIPNGARCPQPELEAAETTTVAAISAHTVLDMDKIDAMRRTNDVNQRPVID